MRLDLAEAPQGWFKRFDSFLILGEAECIKTLYTIYAPAIPGQIPWILTNGKSVGADLDLPKESVYSAGNT